MYIFIYINIYTQTYTHICTQILHDRLSKEKRVCMKSAYLCVCIYIHTHVHLYKHTYIRTFVRRYSMKDLAKKSVPELESWLDERWLEKDTLLEVCMYVCMCLDISIWVYVCTGT